MKTVKLTQYSHGAGCGCKISPMLLDEILKNSEDDTHYANLLVGNSNKDDAAAYDIGDGRSVISTTDFFMPIVDDPYTFGQIAATNAISDIYAMGAKPLMAISIFGWPIDKLDAQTASEVIQGGRATCKEAGIALAGGHSIDSPEPIFGLAVTGIAENKNLMTNDNATDDCLIYLTKPIGIGILTTAQKQNKIQGDDITPAIKAMTTLNKIGAKIATLKGVKAMTDITGFGLLGHLIEVCEASQISAQINFDDVALLPKVEKYRQLGCIPGGSRKNFASYGDKVTNMTQQQREILCDAQTSGGLLIFVQKEYQDEFNKFLKQENIQLKPIGKTSKPKDKAVSVV